MKLKLTIIAAFSICFLISCQKEYKPDGANIPVTPPSNKLRTYIEDASQTSSHSIDTFNVTYDNTNRITGLVSSQGSFLYSYLSNSTAGLDIYSGGALIIHEEAFLNGLSLLDSTIQFNNTNDTTTEKYFYTGTMLTKQVTYDYSTVSGTSIFSTDTYTYDSNGNAIKDVETDGAGNVQTTLNYTYSTYLNNVSISPAFIPFKYKYLPATATELDESGTVEDVVTYTYEFDSNNRLIKETDAAQSGDVVVKKYIYF